MPALRFVPIPTALARSLRAGPDANGLPPEHMGASTGAETPCRHCLRQVPRGAPHLLVAHRPFAGLNPYTETGPIFLCADDCPPGGPDFPAAMLAAPAYLLRGYSAAERIVPGSGAAVPTGQIETRARHLLSDPATAFVHVRSASNNCFFCRIERA